jgi:hypothetical protein
MFPVKVAGWTMRRFLTKGRRGTRGPFAVEIRAVPVAITDCTHGRSSP